MRTLSLIAVLILGLGAAYVFGATDDAPDDASLIPTESAPPEREASEAPSLASGGWPRRPMRRALPPPQPTEAERAHAKRLADAWERAVTLHGMDQTARALALLAPFVKTDAAYFETPERAKALAAMRAAAARLVSAEVAGERLDKLVAELQRWGNLRPIDDDIDHVALETKLRHAAGVIAKVKSKQDRERMLRHLKRFLVAHSDGSLRVHGTARTRDGKPTLDVDALLDAVDALENAREEAVLPLPIAEPDKVEERRMAQLEALRQRGALTVLDALHAGLAWLALHQAEDGSFSDKAAYELSAKRHEDDAKVLSLVRRHFRRASTRYAVSTTALALMAFLDFRDQDERGLFEPTIARAVQWLRKQQGENGLFSKVGRHYYSDAIALMALAQAAHATGDDTLRERVARGLATLYELRGPHGGYRYSAEQVGDTSVTGWVVQAVEYAQVAGIEVPDGMQADLLRFHDEVSIGGAGYHYVPSSRFRAYGSPSLAPVGMLIARILKDEVPKKDRAAWGSWLTKGVGKRAPHLYTLYYGVRMDVWVHGKLTTKWHGWLKELARRQIACGPMAGAFPTTVGRWTGMGGTSLVTAFALLTMEHALFSR